MKIENLKQIAKAGKLKLHKYTVGKFVRNVPIYKSKKLSDDFDADDDFFKITGYKKISFTRYIYSCRTEKMPEHQSYKITRKDYKELLASGAKEETA